MATAARDSEGDAASPASLGAGAAAEATVTVVDGDGAAAGGAGAGGADEAWADPYPDVTLEGMEAMVERCRCGHGGRALLCFALGCRDP